MIEIKKTSLVIVPYALALVGLFVLVGIGKITWTECVAGLVLLNVPAALGLSKKSDGKSTPPPKLPLVLLAVVLAGHEIACGYGKPACAVVDVAKANCDLWIRYLAEDGSVREVQIPKEEATQLARATAKRRALEARDGGVP